MDILWSCLTIFILCTWTILHLNVPRIRPAAGTLKKFWFVIVDSRTKIQWMLITMVMPELILAKAVTDRAAANEWFKHKSTRNNRPVQNYLANMGHFVLDRGHADEGPEDGLDVENKVEPKDGAPTLPDRFRELQAHIDAMVRDITADARDEPLASMIQINAKRLKSRYWALNARQWVCMKEWGIAELPDTPDYQLEHLGSGGGLVKIIALVQIFWLALQLLVRLICRNPSSQLEVAALAFAAQSALTYCVNLSKPHDVTAVRIVRPRAWGDDRFTNGGELQHMMKQLAAAGPTYLWTRARLPPQFDEDVGPSPIPNDGTHQYGTHGVEKDMYLYINMQTTITALIISAGGLVFGSIHCAAWNSTFPTPGERIAWRVCAIITAALPLMALFLVGSLRCFLAFWGMVVICMILPISSDLLNTRLGLAFMSAIMIEELTLRLIFKTFGLCLLVLYTLTRLFLIVETIRALFNSPPEVYRNTCTAEIVHG